jgi:hypothetical protein
MRNSAEGVFPGGAPSIASRPFPTAPARETHFGGGGGVGLRARIDRRKLLILYFAVFPSLAGLQVNALRVTYVEAVLMQPFYRVISRAPRRQASPGVLHGRLSDVETIVHGNVVDPPASGPTSDPRAPGRAGPTQVPHEPAWLISVLPPG